MRDIIIQLSIQVGRQNRTKERNTYTNEPTNQPANEWTNGRPVAGHPTRRDVNDFDLETRSTLNLRKLFVAVPIPVYTGL